ncbi:MAG: hypothetical protein IT494_02405, partial [Gammaproteobacteria bacterium]|nr:hypothetical protein [Gammaproteobacteria bacterium]
MANITAAEPAAEPPQRSSSQRNRRNAASAEAAAKQLSIPLLEEAKVSEIRPARNLRRKLGLPVSPRSKL